LRPRSIAACKGVRKLERLKEKKAVPLGHSGRTTSFEAESEEGEEKGVAAESRVCERGRPQRRKTQRRPLRGEGQCPGERTYSNTKDSGRTGRRKESLNDRRKKSPCLKKRVRRCSTIKKKRGRSLQKVGANPRGVWAKKEGLRRISSRGGGEG